MKDNDFPTEMRAFNIKAKKRDLGKAKREIRKKVADLKEVREGRGGGGLKGRLDYFPEIRLLWYPDPSLRVSCDIFFN